MPMEPLGHVKYSGAPFPRTPVSGWIIALQRVTVEQLAGLVDPGTAMLSSGPTIQSGASGSSTGFHAIRADA